jgi:transcriptional regulator with GAF, ATPase, and Fis domain
MQTMVADVEGPTGTLFTSGSLTASTHRGFRLEVLRGPNAPSRRLIDVAEFRIGKASANHLALADPAVSRFHCVIEYTPRGLLLRDLGSTNGTQVGNCWIERAYLNPMVPIQIGRTTLQVVAMESGRAPPVPEPPRESPMLGSSPAVERLLAALAAIDKSGVTVLLEGETGTGKSLLAETIHQCGPRQQGPYVVVDCGAIAPTLIESELFGHERGAFTGATERRVGAFEAANGGTIFLDEVGELPLQMQPKLLRALEERTIKPVGSTQSVRVNVQVVAATNRDLREAVSQGDFRADLYYRLDSLRLRLPPLRDRPQEIPALIEKFARRIRPDIDAGFLDGLTQALNARQEWPGNIRELRNSVEKAILLGELPNQMTGPVEVPAALTAQSGASAGSFDADTSFRDAKDRAMADWERVFLRSLVDHARGNLSLAARLVQMDRGHLRSLLRRYQIPVD